MQKRFWMFLDMELADLQQRFEKIFQVDNLYHDYENVWEWLESSDRESAVYLNVSRSHDWKQGNYKEPVNILVENNSTEPVDVDDIGEKLFEAFNTTVFFGELKIETKDREHYFSKIERVFNGNRPMKEVLQALDKMDFHDAPIESIRVISDPKLVVVLSFFQHLEASNNYRQYELQFNEISLLEIGSLLLDANCSLEIHRFDYSFENAFDGTMTFLTGFGKPAFDMKIQCKALEIRLVSGEG